jgi:hypothetical protein
MNRFAILLLSPLLIAFAPVPIIKPMTAPDREIEQFAADVQQRNDGSVFLAKRRLVLRLEELHANLARSGKIAEADRVRERLLLVNSIDVGRPLGGVTPTEIMKRASVDGKYRYLLHVLYAPNDRTPYGEYNDFGHWQGTSYLGNSDLKAGHWIYMHPRWFIWREGPPSMTR